MKKIAIFCLSLVMLLSLSLAVFAASDVFVSSPTGNSAPTVESFESADEECTAILVCTPYSERNVLSEALVALLEKASSSIIEADDLTKLNEDLKKLIEDKELDSKNLSVSDLFDLHITGCDFHDGHFDFDIVLAADTLSHFVALLHMNKDGEWELVKDARVTNNDEHLEFSVESLSPFAIVVDTSEAPPTNDASMMYVWIMIAAASGALFVLVGAKAKNKKA